MKKLTGWLCLLAFAAVSVGLISFLQLFTADAGTAGSEYIDWQESWIVSPDGSVRSFDMLSGQPELKEGEYIRLSLVLPEGRAEGVYMVFEVTGASIVLKMDGEELYRSSAVQHDGTTGLGQLQLPMPSGGGEELTMELVPLGEMWLFPPMLRLTDDPENMVSTMSYANYYAIPAGAAALATALLCGLFLLELSSGRFQWRLLPLMLAAVGLTVYPISRSCGSYFLPEFWVRICTWEGMPLLCIIAAAAYLVLHRDRAFWRLLGSLSLLSLAALAAVTLAAYLRGGYLARYLQQLMVLVSQGSYSEIFYWVTLWLVAVCTLLGIWELVRYLVAVRTRAHTLELKNALVMDNYRAIEAKLRETAAVRHEFSHRLAALDAMLRSGDMEGLGRSLSEWKHQSESPQAVYTHNLTVNAIVQDAAARAESAGVRFDAEISVPERVDIPDEDLCCLLMNMLDNALEAARRAPEGERDISLRITVREGFFAVLCENSYAGELSFDERGRPLTTKQEKEKHGFGMAQMAAVAEKYHGELDVSHTDRVFTVRTALRI